MATGDPDLHASVVSPATPDPPAAARPPAVLDPSVGPPADIAAAPQAVTGSAHGDGHAAEHGDGHAAEHGADHSSDHGEAPLGPVDWGAWLLSGAGVGAGALIALLLFVAIQHG